MSRPTGRDKTKPKGKSSPEAKAKSSTTTVPEGFSIFGSGGFAGVKKEVPSGGGSIFSSVPSGGTNKQNLFADLAKKVENYQPEDTSEDEDEDDEEDEDGEFDGEEEEEGEFEDEEEEEDGEWIEGDDGDESPVEVKYQPEASAKLPAQTSSLFGSISQPIKTAPKAAEPAPPPIDPAKQKAELEAARRAAQEQQERRRREAEEAETQRKKDEEIKRREELKQQLLTMMKNELKVAQQEQQYYQSLQKPSQPDRELVEFMEYVEGGPYTALPVCRPVNRMFCDC